MRIALRADAGLVQGTGHVMRMATLAIELQRRDHEVVLITSTSGIPWLHEYLSRKMISTVSAKYGAIDITAIHKMNLDAVVFDGYEFAPQDTERLMDAVPFTLAVIDGSTLGYSASLYLDQNLTSAKPEAAHLTKEKILGGLRYCLIREEILAERALRIARWPEISRGLRGPSVLVIMGGSDYRGIGGSIGRLLENLRMTYSTLTVVDPSVNTSGQRDSSGSSIRYVAPQPNLHELYRAADFVISAAGTTSFELIACGLPAALLVTADNQRSSYTNLVNDGYVVGLGDASSLLAAPADGLAGLERVLGNPSLRARMALMSLTALDGRGASRVACIVEGRYTPA